MSLYKSPVKSLSRALFACSSPKDNQEVKKMKRTNHEPTPTATMYKTYFDSWSSKLFAVMPPAAYVVNRPNAFPMRNDCAGDEAPDMIAVRNPTVSEGMCFLVVK